MSGAGDVPMDPMLAGPAALARKRAREDNDADDFMHGAPVKRRRTLRAGGATTKKKAAGSSGVAAGTPAQENVQLVGVRGNDKVLRCLRCRSFVSRNKQHGLTECDQVLRNKANPQRRSAGSRGGKFRMTPKRRDILLEALKDTAKGRLQEAQVERRFKTLRKWAKKTDAKGRLSKRSKEMFEGVLSALEVDYNLYNKKYNALRRKLGV